MRTSATFIWVSGALAFPLLAGVTVLTIVDSVSSSIYLLELAIVAAALNVVALGSLTLVLTIALRTGFRTKHSSGSLWRATAIPIVCGCICLAAAAVTLVELVVNRQHAVLHTDRTRMTITIALSSGAIAAQAVFYLLVLIAARGSTAYEPRLADVRPYTSEPKPPPLSQHALTPSRPVTRHDEQKQSPLLNSSTTSLPTMRSSITQAMRPMTSKTRLVRTPATERSQLSHSLRSSIDSLNRADAFDKWDTSDVDIDTRDAVFSGYQRRQGTLEPIPGSRPSSPGRPLDGPFPEDQHASPETSPVVVEPTTSPYMSRPGTSYSHFPPYGRRNDSRVSIDSTRPSSPAVSEAHIHPLFRTDSLTPPPAHSPNTVIMASPNAGQVIPPPPRAFSRMNSRETMRGGAQSPLGPSRPFSPEQRPSTSSAPPSRVPTPPIPDFVMGVPK